MCLHLSRLLRAKSKISDLCVLFETLKWKIESKAPKKCRVARRKIKMILYATVQVWKITMFYFWLFWSNTLHSVKWLIRHNKLVPCFNAVTLSFLTAKIIGFSFFIMRDFRDKPFWFLWQGVPDEVPWFSRNYMILTVATFVNVLTCFQK